MFVENLISVIIPAHNAGKYIEQCICNILFQTYKQLEIIVVDDGSTDDTAEIVAKYPVILVQQANSGVSVARNAGFELAKGEFVHFMDVDDFINPDFYLKMFEALTQSNAEMACCNVQHERLPALSTDYKHRLLLISPEDKMYYTNVGSQGAAYKYLYRKSFLLNIGIQFLPELINAQDKVFTLQTVYHASSIVLCPEAVYYYKYRDNSNMTNKSKDKIKLRKECVKNANAFCADFAKKHQLKLINMPKYKEFPVEILGLPLLVKRVYQTGRKQYRLGRIKIVQIKA